MNVREALDAKRIEKKDIVNELVLCKSELFYLPSTGNTDPNDTVYPVSMAMAIKEAEFFGCNVTEQ